MEEIEKKKCCRPAAARLQSRGAEEAATSELALEQTLASVDRVCEHREDGVKIFAAEVSIAPFADDMTASCHMRGFFPHA
jgi:hypothetical protein